MKATCSYSAGLCVIDGDAEGSPQILSCVGALTQSTFEPWMSLINDWEVISYTEVDDLAKNIRDAYWIKRSSSLLEAILAPDNDELAEDVIEQVAECLQTRVSADRVLSSLLIAPLEQPNVVRERFQLASARGFGEVAYVLDRLYELQPLLRRFVHAWLSLPRELFAQQGVRANTLWCDLATSGLLLQLSNASTGQQVRDVFTAMAFREETPALRGAVARIGNALADAIFEPNALREHSVAELAKRDRHSLGNAEGDRATLEAGHVLSGRAQKQIQEIVELVGEGRDDRADRFLSELVETQLKGTHDTRYVVMSLCNIAKHCADLFRTDYEAKCLRMAVEIEPNDPWTLTQLGDHYKRVGRFEDAIKVLQDATLYGDSEVPRSIIADVFAQQGQYEQAIKKYRDIPGAETRVAIRTAIGDNYRRLGDFLSAMREYNQLLSEGYWSDRIIAGKAEIAKQQGRLVEAKNAYDDLITDAAVTPTARVIYKMALIRILARLNSPMEALELADGIIEDAPFFMAARVAKASILGLLDREQEAIESLSSDDSPKAFDEWIRIYTRGLILLKLNRSKDARDQLVKNVNAAVLNDESRNLLRLCAALAFLRLEHLTTAKQFLEDVSIPHDSYARHIIDVLHLHLAVARNDSESVSTLKAKLSSARLDAYSRRAVEHLLEKRWKLAFAFEIKAMLSLAA